MSNSPLVSIISCFYNEESFIEQAIQSVISQTYSNWELILVDDGSVDKSTEIAKKYSDLFSGKIVYAEHADHQNNGLSPSRNLGLSLAKGSYICFLDADDTYMPEKIRAQVAIMQNNKDVDLLIEATEYWYDWKGESLENVVVQIGARDGKYLQGELVLLLYPLGPGQSPCTSSWMVQKESVYRIGGFSNEFINELALYEDQAFLCKYYLNGIVFVSSDCHSRYRQRESSIVYSVKRSGKYEYVRTYFLKYFRKYLKKQVNQEREVIRRIDKELLKYNPIYKAMKSFFNLLKLR